MTPRPNSPEDQEGALDGASRIGTAAARLRARLVRVARMHPALAVAAAVGLGAVAALAIGALRSPERRAARRDAEVAETGGRWEAAARAAPVLDEDY